MTTITTTDDTERECDLCRYWTADKHLNRAGFKHTDPQRIGGLYQGLCALHTTSTDRDQTCEEFEPLLS